MFSGPGLSTTSTKTTVSFTDASGNTLNMTPAGTGATYVGTWHATPNSTSDPTITVTGQPEQRADVCD